MDINVTPAVKSRLNRMLASPNVKKVLVSNGLYADFQAIVVAMNYCCDKGLIITVPTGPVETAYNQLLNEFNRFSTNVTRNNAFKHADNFAAMMMLEARTIETLENRLAAIVAMAPTASVADKKKLAKEAGEIVTMRGELALRYLNNYVAYKQATHTDPIISYGTRTGADAVDVAALISGMESRAAKQVSVVGLPIMFRNSESVKEKYMVKIVTSHWHEAGKDDNYKSLISAIDSEMCAEITAGISAPSYTYNTGIRRQRRAMVAGKPIPSYVDFLTMTTGGTPSFAAYQSSPSGTMFGEFRDEAAFLDYVNSDAFRQYVELMEIGLYEPDYKAKIRSKEYSASDFFKLKDGKGVERYYLKEHAFVPKKLYYGKGKIYATVPECVVVEPDAGAFGMPTWAKRLAAGSLAVSMLFNAVAPYVSEIINGIAEKDTSTQTPVDEIEENPAAGQQTPPKTDEEGNLTPDFEKGDDADGVVPGENGNTSTGEGGSNINDQRGEYGTSDDFWDMDVTRPDASEEDSSTGEILTLEPSEPPVQPEPDQPEGIGDTVVSDEQTIDQPDGSVPGENNGGRGQSGDENFW